MIRVLTFPIAVKFDKHLGSRGCRGACQISKRYVHYNIQSRGFETSRDLVVLKTPACLVTRGQGSHLWYNSHFYFQECSPTTRPTTGTAMTAVWRPRHGSSTSEQPSGLDRLYGSSSRSPWSVANRRASPFFTTLQSTQPSSSSSSLSSRSPSSDGCSSGWTIIWWSSPLCWYWSGRYALTRV